MGIDLARFRAPALSDAELSVPVTPFPAESTVSARVMSVPASAGSGETVASLPPLPFRVVCVAEFSLRKNQSALIEAFAHTAPQMPDVRLVFAGEGTELDRCKMMASALGISDRVEFMGFVKDIPNLLRHCDLLVSASRHEGLPFCVMEAMAMGLPILASDIAGHRDLLPRDAMFENVPELAGKLIDHYDRGKIRVIYPQMSFYSIESVQKEWHMVFDSLLSKNEAQPGEP
jgi:glycosyltransferase involved in cell wall biosynthesis